MAKKEDAIKGDTVYVRVRRWSAKQEMILPAIVMHATPQRLRVSFDTSSLKDMGYSGVSPRHMQFLRKGPEFPKVSSLSRSFSWYLVNDEPQPSRDTGNG